jgi:K+-sensing histidine kinase KdpD
LSALPQAELAMRSGGTVFFCEGEDVAQTLLALAQREQIDVLILGAPARRWRLRRGVVDRVVNAPRNFDVVVAGQP